MTNLKNKLTKEQFHVTQEGGTEAPFSGEFKDLGESLDHSKIKEEMKELLLQRITSRKNRVAATDEFVLKDRDYSKEDDIMIGVW